MKIAEQIAQEIKKHKPIDKTNVMYDETWEDYLRGGKMTIEQAKSELMQMYGALAPNKQIAIDTLIKASVKSQEPILDDIRAEIEGMDFDFGDFYDHTETIRKMVLKVIDKYY